MNFEIVNSNREDAPMSFEIGGPRPTRSSR